MGAGIALGLGNAIGSVLVLIVGLWVLSTTGVLVVFWVVTALSATTALLALAFPAELMREQRPAELPAAGDRMP